MRYLALACDYDGTLARDGTVSEKALAALVRARESGRRLVLVTGRRLDDLLAVFQHADLFDRIVAENGALLYRPASHEEVLLAESPPATLIEALRGAPVAPLSLGRVIIATWQPNEGVVLDVIRRLGLELQVVFNKGAVMVLPSGTNKATGLAAALREIGISLHNAVAVGDAENDHALVTACECAVAVANAVPMLKQRVDLVTDEANGAGVVALVERLVTSDLVELAPRLGRHDIQLGTRDDGSDVRLRHGESVLIAGPSGSGKSALATAILERLAERRYQFCVVDPEGDHQMCKDAVVLGDDRRPPGVGEVLDVLANADQSATVNLLGLKLEDRARFFGDLLPRLQELRGRTGRPHWILADEAHHLLPALWEPTAVTLPHAPKGFLLVTVHPDHVSPAVLASVDTIIAVGGEPEGTLRAFGAVHDRPPPLEASVALEAGMALSWSPRSGTAVRFRIAPPRSERRRHQRKYAEGKLGADKSFYFRGPEGKLNLRAQNLALFNQLAEGVDDATWFHHLERGDYSRWIREAIKDEELADEVAAMETRADLDSTASRREVRAAIERRYTGEP